MALRPGLDEYSSGSGDDDGWGEDGTLVATGDRDGCVRVWDVSPSSLARPPLLPGTKDSSACIGVLSGHRGHVTAMTWMSAVNRYTMMGDDGRPHTSPPPDPAYHHLLLTGAQDGHLRVWDVRSKTPAFNLELHTTESAAGAVGDICVTRAPTSLLPLSSTGDECTYETLVVTAGADKTICVLDPRRGFAPRHRFTEHTDFLYSLHTVGPICLSGGGDGMLLAHDLTSGRPLWGLGANMAAVRCLGSVGFSIVTSGDDGNALFYDF